MKKSEFYKIVKKTIEKAEKQQEKAGWHTHMWYVARSMKTHFPNIDHEKLWIRLDKCVKDIYGGWKNVGLRGNFPELDENHLDNPHDMGDVTDEDIQMDFLHSIESVRSVDSLELAFQWASKFPLNIDNHASGKYPSFVSLIGYFCYLHRKRVMGVPREHLANRFGVKKVDTISGWCRWAISDGWLELHSEHIPKRKSTRYRISNDLKKAIQKSVDENVGDLLTDLSNKTGT